MSNRYFPSLLLAAIMALTALPSIAFATDLGDLHCNDANGVALTNGQVVTVQGVVTANQPTGSLNRLYIQDATGGVNVFGSPQICTLNVGDLLNVTGTVAQFNGLTEVASTASAGLVINLLSSGNPLPPPLVESIAQVNGTFQASNCEPTESELVKVLGLLRTSTGALPAPGAVFVANTNYRLTSTGSDSTTVFATVRVVQSANTCNTTNSLVGVSIPRACPANVVGVLSQFDSTSPFTSGYQILPTDASSVTPACGTVSTQPSTWGQVKVKYR